jgi:RNA polymerase sigma-70 factor (ECF subfamily)
LIFFKQNNQVAFDKLYEEYHDKVRGTLYRMLLENAKAEILDELEQEVFIKAWKALGTFEFKSKVSTWLYRISVNTAIDFLRKQKIQPTTLVDEILEDDIKINKDLKIDISKLLMELDEKHRAILVLFYFEERSLKEISQILEIQLGTVKSRLNTARKKAEALYER